MMAAAFMAWNFFGEKLITPRRRTLSQFLAVKQFGVAVVKDAPPFHYDSRAAFCHPDHIRRRGFRLFR
jgi:hypothetical protein